MPARVMLSSVTKDDLPLGDVGQLKDFWFASEKLKALAPAGSATPKSAPRVDFTFVRNEVQQHLERKYGLKVYNFQNTPTSTASPEKATIFETDRSHLVIGLFGSQSGWKVPDQDPLTPTFREWRAALNSPLKFKLFMLKGAADVKMPPALSELIQDIRDYKKGVICLEFADAVELFTLLDRTAQDYINEAVVRYAYDYAAKQPTSETERWLLLPYRARVQEMMTALQGQAQSLGISGDVLTLGSNSQPVQLHCVPDSFSVPESKKFAAYVFDDEISEKPSPFAKLHVVAAFGGITELQVRRHLGNFEAAEVYTDYWGIYGCIPGSGMQCVYLPKCVNSRVMQSKLSGAITWLEQRASDITALAQRRKQILDLSSTPAALPKIRRAGSKG